MVDSSWPRLSIDRGEGWSNNMWWKTFWLSPAYGLITISNFLIFTVGQQTIPITLSADLKNRLNRRIYINSMLESYTSWCHSLGDACFPPCLPSVTIHSPFAVSLPFSAFSIKQLHRGSSAGITASPHCLRGGGEGKSLFLPRLASHLMRRTLAAHADKWVEQPARRWGWLVAACINLDELGRIASCPSLAMN